MALGASFVASSRVHSGISFAHKYAQLLKYSGQTYLATLSKWEGFGKALDELVGRTSLDPRYSHKSQPSILFQTAPPSADPGIVFTKQPSGSHKGKQSCGSGRER